MLEKRVLLVEDDDDIAEVISVNVGQLGYEVDRASNGQDGLKMGLERTYALVILDLTLPKLGGLEICRQLRQNDPSLQILVVSAKDAEVDRVLGLELGADDYVTKPFSVHELTARVRARLRQRHSDVGRPDVPVSDGESLIFDELVIDPGHRLVTRRGEEVELTAMEFDLLLFLASQPGKPFTRDELLQAVWGSTLPAYETNVNSSINRLRKKIEENPKEPQYLLTVWGYGYKWMTPEG